jgi:hypothetical protein
MQLLTTRSCLLKLLINVAGSVPAAVESVGATPPMIKTTTVIRRERPNTADTLEPFAAIKR